MTVDETRIQEIFGEALDLSGATLNHNLEVDPYTPVVLGPITGGSFALSVFPTVPAGCRFRA